MFCSSCKQNVRRFDGLVQAVNTGADDGSAILGMADVLDTVQVDEFFLLSSILLRDTSCRSPEAKKKLSERYIAT